MNSKNAFHEVPHSPAGHFHLLFYAAVYSLINYIRHLAENGDQELEAALAAYPFLGHYLVEMLPYLDDDLAWREGPAWWQQQIQEWERASVTHLPLMALEREGGVGFEGRLILIMAGLLEEDSRFGTLFADLQEPLAHRRPGLELLAQIMAQDERNGRDPWQLCRPLIATGLLTATNQDAPRSEWILRVPPLLWATIRGESDLSTWSWCRHYPAGEFPEVETLIFPEDFRAQLAQVPALIDSGKALTVILRGSPGSDRRRAIGAIGRRMGRGLVVVDGSSLAKQQGWPSLGPFCAMAQAMPVLTYELAPGETVEAPVLAGYQGPMGILLGHVGGLRGPVSQTAVTLTVPPLKAAHRRRCWQEALAGHPVENLSRITERFHLAGGHIRQVGAMAIAHAALEQSRQVTPEHIRQACRTLNRQLLDTLAMHLDAGGSWDQLVVSDSTAAKLLELEQRCRHRERVLEHLAPTFGSTGNRGVRALFTGASGTGKTLTARILAAELGIDLYRVDLAAVVNKYIGETEKNLHRVLSTAEELDVILLLDEGDALLSSRTEVRSANDRYANLETNYLLQRLENYQGIVIITTNLGENIDSAFQRRMDVVVNFIAPRAEERWLIWQFHLPTDHAVDDLYLEEVAIRCAMSGGQIRNAALHATLLAVDTGRPVVTGRHLAQAIQSEYRKAGAISPLNDNHLANGRQGNMASFLDALAH